MSISWFCVWSAEGGPPPVVAEADRMTLNEELAACPGLSRGHVMTPSLGSDPFYPYARNQTALLLQLEFDDIMDLERSLAADGHLAFLTDADRLASLAGTKISHQAMLTRRYPVAEPVVGSVDGSTLSYMVEYDGVTADENAWHQAYVAQHPTLLAKFPGIRAIEIYTPATIICGLPIRLRTAMQRNKTVFDSPEAMQVAMASPARAELRADYLTMPRFDGVADHSPFRAVELKRRAAMVI